MVVSVSLCVIENLVGVDIVDVSDTFFDPQSFIPQISPIIRCFFWTANEMHFEHGKVVSELIE
jgi:hypothetical protein